MVTLSEERGHGRLVAFPTHLNVPHRFAEALPAVTTIARGAEAAIRPLTFQIVSLFDYFVQQSSRDLIALPPV